MTTTKKKNIKTDKKERTQKTLSVQKEPEVKEKTLSRRIGTKIKKGFYKIVSPIQGSSVNLLAAAVLGGFGGYVFNEMSHIQDSLKQSQRNIRLIEQRDNYRVEKEILENKYQDALTNLKGLEEKHAKDVNNFNLKYLPILEQNNQLNTKVGVLEEKLKISSVEVKKLTGEVGKSSKELEDLNKKYTVILEKNIGLGELNAKLITSNKGLVKRIEDANNIIVGLSADKNKFNQSYVEMAESKKELEQRIQALNNDVNDMNNLYTQLLDENQRLGQENVNLLKKSNKAIMEFLQMRQEQPKIGVYELETDKRVDDSSSKVEERPVEDPLLKEIRDIRNAGIGIVFLKGSYKEIAKMTRAQDIYEGLNYTNKEIMERLRKNNGDDRAFILDLNGDGFLDLAYEGNVKEWDICKLGKKDGSYGKAEDISNSFFKRKVDEYLANMN